MSVVHGLIKSLLTNGEQGFDPDSVLELMSYPVDFPPLLVKPPFPDLPITRNLLGEIKNGNAILNKRLDLTGRFTDGVNRYSNAANTYWYVPERVLGTQIGIHDQLANPGKMQHVANMNLASERDSYNAAADLGSRPETTPAEGFTGGLVKWLQQS